MADPLTPPAVAAIGAAFGSPPVVPSDRATLRPAPGPTRPRRRDGPRKRAPGRHPRRLGHSKLGITSIYLQGIDNAEIIDTVHGRHAPMIRVNALLRR